MQGVQAHGELSAQCVLDVLDAMDNKGVWDADTILVTQNVVDVLGVDVRYEQRFRRHPDEPLRTHSYEHGSSTRLNDITGIAGRLNMRLHSH